MRQLLDRWYANSKQIAPVRIPGLNRKHLMHHLAERGLVRGAEIGVDRGRFSEYILRNTACEHLLCVDPWYWRLRGESRYQSTVRRLAPFGERVTIDRRKSFEAVFDVPDGSLDWCFIDGNHQFDYVATDVIWWSYKVRDGGIVAAHDFFRFRGGGVVPAIEVYTREHGITRWFLTDEKCATAFWLKEPEPFDLDQK